MFVLGVAILTGVALYFRHTVQAVTQQTKGLTPRTVSALPRVQLIIGQKAVESIQQLHGKDFFLEDGAVAVYGNQNVTLWISDAGSVEAATDLSDLMKVRIAEGRSPFIEVDAFEIDGFAISELEGLGQNHYYWQVDELVIWLAADASIAEGALQEVIDYLLQAIV